MSEKSICHALLHVRGHGLLGKESWSEACDAMLHRYPGWHIVEYQRPWLWTRVKVRIHVRTELYGIWGSMFPSRDTGDGSGTQWKGTESCWVHEIAIWRDQAKVTLHILCTSKVLGPLQSHARFASVAGEH